MLLIIVIKANTLVLAKNLPVTKDDFKPHTLQYKFNQIQNVGYKFSYKLSDGQSREEYGFFDDNRIWHVEGFYIYRVGDEEFVVNYSADQNGNKNKTTF